MTVVPEVEGGRQARGPAAYDRDLLAGPGDIIPYAQYLVSPVGGSVGDVPLEPPYHDRLAPVVQGADLLAVGGADAAARLAEGIRVVEDAERLVEVPLADRPDVLRDVHVRRAGLDAEAALDAAGRLLSRELLVVAERHLIEGFPSLLRFDDRHIGGFRL